MSNTNSGPGHAYPRYKSHKEVEAFKIADINWDADIAKNQNRETDGSATLIPEDNNLNPHKVTAEYIKKHKPQIGGYWVRYADGYESWSPARQFEEGNTLMPKGILMNFGQAITEMKLGKKITRGGWIQGMYVTYMPGYPEGIEVNEATQKAHNLPPGSILKYRPYMQLFTSQGDVIMWSPSVTDVLSEDWIVV